MPSREPQAEPNLSVELDDPYVRRLIKERFFQWAVNEAGGARINWPRVSETLERYGGVRIDSETLRKNFRLASKKQGKPPNQFKNKATWLSLYRFLVSDAVSYLSPHELPTQPFAYYAFAGLQQFIDPSGASIFPEPLVGRFDNSLGLGSATWPVCLDVLGPARPGPIRIELREFDEVSVLEDVPDSRYSYSGGAVHRQDGFLMAVVRETTSGHIRTLILLQTHPALREAQTVQTLALLSIDGLVAQPLVSSKDEHGLCVDPKSPGMIELPDLDVLHDIIFLTRS